VLWRSLVVVVLFLVPLPMQRSLLRMLMLLMLLMVLCGSNYRVVRHQC
jgi:hypothetical protein